MSTAIQVQAAPTYGRIYGLLLWGGSVNNDDQRRIANGWLDRGKERLHEELREQMNPLDRAGLPRTFLGMDPGGYVEGTKPFDEMVQALNWTRDKRVRPWAKIVTQWLRTVAPRMHAAPIVYVGSAIDMLKRVAEAMPGQDQAAVCQRALALARESIAKLVCGNMAASIAIDEQGNAEADLRAPDDFHRDLMASLQFSFAQVIAESCYERQKQQWLRDGSYPMMVRAAFAPSQPEKYMDWQRGDYLIIDGMPDGVRGNASAERDYCVSACRAMIPRGVNVILGTTRIDGVSKADLGYGLKAE